MTVDKHKAIIYNITILKERHKKRNKRRTIKWQTKTMK